MSTVKNEAQLYRGSAVQHSAALGGEGEWAADLRVSFKGCDNWRTDGWGIKAVTHSVGL